MRDALGRMIAYTCNQAASLPCWLTQSHRCPMLQSVHASQIQALMQSVAMHFCTDFINILLFGFLF